MENKYIIKYLPTFINQFNEILYYLKNKLKNKIVADKFYKDVISKIEKRSEFPMAFEVFKKTKNEKVNWYTIQVRNFTVFYVVKDNCMEVRRIYYNKRNFDKLIKSL